jgi:hypothetical protein
LSSTPSAEDRLALDVSQHREWQVLQVRVVVAPCQMYEFAVDRRAINHGVAVVEFAVDLAERGYFSRADEGEVLRPEEQHFPLARVRCLVDALKRLVLLD